MKERPRSGLEDALAAALQKRTKQSTIRKLTTFPPEAADFSSNDFLSLSTSKELRDEFMRELDRDPVLLQHTGSGGSRLLDGNSQYAEKLEQDIATFHGAEAGLLCNSGFDANTGLFSCLPQRGDVIVYDEYIHASVHDGMRLSRAKEKRFFSHNDMQSLRNVLEQCIEEDSHLRTGSHSVFIAVEAVYSMDGDVAPLQEILSLRNELLPNKNGHLIVDEAHSNGIFGPNGRGLVSSLDLEKEITIRLHTFGKALASNGAILLCSPLLREYLINYARPMIYTTFMSYPALAAIRASYNFLMRGRTEPLTQNLWRLVRILHSKLLELQSSLSLPIHLAPLLRAPKSLPETPIFAVLSSEPKALAAHCQRRNFVVRGIVSPTVPRGTERIRVCLHAGNSVREIDGLIGVIREWVEIRMREIEDAGGMKARL